MRVLSGGRGGGGGAWSPPHTPPRTRGSSVRPAVLFVELTYIHIRLARTGTTRGLEVACSRVGVVVAC